MLTTESRSQDIFSINVAAIYQISEIICTDSGVNKTAKFLVKQKKVNVGLRAACVRIKNTPSARCPYFSTLNVSGSSFNHTKPHPSTTIMSLFLLTCMNLTLIQNNLTETEVV